jgi:methylglutaconyl-CoA hydratase
MLDRVEHRNALNAELTEQLIEVVNLVEADDSVRVILLTGAGAAFCGGVDLSAMRSHGIGGDIASNLADAQRLADLMLALHSSRKPTLAVVNGAAVGAGVGLVAACDIALCSTAAHFRLPEVQLGIVPAAISPHLVDAMGVRRAKRFALTGEVIEPVEAQKVGLVHEVTEPGNLTARALEIATRLSRGGPLALAACKQLFEQVAHRARDSQLARECAQTLAELRSSPEGREGVAAALARRPPNWLS